ncbi:DUF6319 family protein [Nocardia sp. 004]|uniref:DUF6319 family protein n=1 Tax=Nocardia sp. 004 TaxID=3385978 RepID=UPI0039A07B36
MPSPRTTPQPLSNSEIEQIATDIAGGRPPMVWFTAAAVGVPEGRSGKVIALGDPADGDFLQVRPTGSKDVLSFSPTEVTLTKPPRGPAGAAQPKQAEPKQAEPKQTARKEPTVPQPPSSQASASAPAPTPKTHGSTSGAKQPDDAAESVAKSAPAAKPAKTMGARKTAKSPEVVVTLTGTADGDWSVDVMSGKKRTVRGLPVPSSAVAQASKILHPEVAEVVDGVLETLRGVQEAKVQQLQAELEEAKRLLEELSD